MGYVPSSNLATANRRKPSCQKSCLTIVGTIFHKFPPNPSDLFLFGGGRWPSLTFFFMGLASSKMTWSFGFGWLRELTWWYFATISLRPLVALTSWLELMPCCLRTWGGTPWWKTGSTCGPNNLYHEKTLTWWLILGTIWWSKLAKKASLLIL